MEHIVDERAASLSADGHLVAGAGFEPTASGLWTYYWFIRNYFFRYKASFLACYKALFLGCYIACFLACYQWLLQEKRPILSSCLSLKMTGSTRFRWVEKSLSGGSSLHSEQWRFQHCDSMTSYVTKLGGQQSAYSEKAVRFESCPSLQNWQEQFFPIAPHSGWVFPETLTATYHPDGSENSPQKPFRSRGHSTLFATGLPPPHTTKAPTI